jgi:hypothetical protein
MRVQGRLPPKLSRASLGDLPPSTSCRHTTLQLDSKVLPATLITKAAAKSHRGCKHSQKLSPVQAPVCAEGGEGSFCFAAPSGDRQLDGSPGRVGTEAWWALHPGCKPRSALPPAPARPPQVRPAPGPRAHSPGSAREAHDQDRQSQHLPRPGAPAASASAGSSPAPGGAWSVSGSPDSLSSAASTAGSVALPGGPISRAALPPRPHAV